MTRKTRMLTSAAALALIGSTALAPAAMADPIPAAVSYADLLEPVPDALARLHADDAMAADAHMIQAQYRGGYDHHHHHHHHHHVRHSTRWYRGHGYFWTGQIWAFGPPPQPRYWHNHDADWYRGRGYSWDGRGWQGPRDHHHHHADRYRGNGYDQGQYQDGRGQPDHHHHHHQNWR
ncbi:hypothetical protein [Novosphingobium sp.]|uniref:hypothetical protein n=1 Tax=Novosphingobium sp. TaxID=1874826 RepID=UPI003342AFB2